MSTVDTHLKNLKRLLAKVFGRSALFVFTALIKPKSIVEDDKRRELILNIILVGTLTMLGIYFVIVVIHSLAEGPNHRGLSVLFFGCIVGIFAMLLVISRKGKFVAASHGLVAAYFIGTTYGAIHFSADTQQILLTFALVIIIASVLVDTAYGFAVTVLACLVTGITWHVQLASGILPYQKWRLEFHETDSIEFIVTFFLIMTVSWLSNRETERSLKRARRSEAELLHERDLLEIKVEERTRDLKQLQLEQVSELSRLAELGSLSSGIFHDLMNPLSAVVASVDRMERKDNALGQTREYLQKAVTASRRMGDHLGKIRKQIRPVEDDLPFSANKELREAVDMLQYKSRTRQVVLEVKENEEVTLYGSALKFHRIALNLISNAIDSYSDARSRTDRVVKISLWRRGPIAVLKVTDYGSGMDEQTQKKIFEPFFTTKKDGGLGIGLPITKSIAEEDFGASLELVSSEGYGTTFTVTFPIQEKHSAPTLDEQQTPYEKARSS